LGVNGIKLIRSLIERRIRLQESVLRASGDSGA